MKKAVLILLFYPFLLNAQTWQWATHIGGAGVENTTIAYV
jgi:hypothetical protein